MVRRWPWLHKYVIAGLIIAFGFLVTPFMKHLAYMERGYEAVGGEYAPLVLSIIAAIFIWQILKEQEERERLHKKGCEIYECKLYEMRTEAEGSEFHKTRVREGMCIQVGNEASVIIFAHSPPKESEGGSRPYAIAVISRGELYGAL